jgi:serine/threonine protein kinase
VNRHDLEDGTPERENGARFARREEMVEEVVAAYLDRLNAGESLDPDAILLEHPDVGAEVLADLETFVQAGGGATGVPCLTIGDYTLRRRIGRGGMGVVYEAWQNSLGRSVALKVLPAGIAADTRAVTRFVREAKIAAQLQHASIVPVYSMGVEGETPYYAMQLVDGETLAQVVERLRAGGGSGTTLAYCHWIADAFSGVAEGLQHAHAQGVIHRDLKPSNLIFDRGESRGADERLAEDRRVSR